jgi:hypothetical protein
MFWKSLELIWKILCSKEQTKFLFQSFVKMMGNEAKLISWSENIKQINSYFWPGVDSTWLHNNVYQIYIIYTRKKLYMYYKNYF